MNPITNILIPLSLNLSSPCPVKRQARTGSVIADRSEPALEAVNDADMQPGRALAGSSEVVHYGHACHTRRFEAWLHGSQVLEVPQPARHQDDPSHQAEALAAQRRAVRETSYLPGRTPLLFL